MLDAKIQRFVLDFLDRYTDLLSIGRRGSLAFGIRLFVLSGGDQGMVTNFFTSSSSSSSSSSSQIRDRTLVLATFVYDAEISQFFSRAKSVNGRVGG